MDCAFESDGDVRSGVGSVRADAGWIDGSAGSEAEGSGQLDREAAFEFGGAEDSVLGAALKGDEGAPVEVATLRNEVKVRARAPRSDAPIQAGAFIGAFPGGAHGRIGTGHEADVLFLRIANGSGNEIEQVALPEIGPAVEGEQVNRGSAETVRADRREHACASGVPAVPDVVAVARLFAGPIQFGRGTSKTVENCRIAGSNFFENASNESVAWRGSNWQIHARRGNCQGSLAGIVNRRGRDWAGDEDKGGKGESKNKPTIHKLPS